MQNHASALTRFARVLGRLLGASGSAGVQAVPNPGEKVEGLVTFGPQAATARSDDDFTQTFFSLVPATGFRPISARVFDPGCVR